MKRWKLSYYGIALLFAGAIAAVLIARSKPSALNENVLEILGTAEVPERNVTRRLVSKPFSSPLGKHLFGSTHIKVSAMGLFVADWGDMQIKRFSFDGRLLNTIGNGQGSGPGEFGNIVDYSVKGDHIWIADSRLLKASLFTVTGDYVRQIKPGGIPLLRLTETESGNLVFLTMHTDGLFARVSGEDSIHVFGEMLKNQVENPLALQGTIESLPGGGFVYAPMFASYIFYFNEKGDLFHAFYTPDGIKFPSGANRVEGGNVIFTPPTSTTIISSLSVDNGYLYVLTVYESEERRSNLDKFKVKTGKYVNSYDVPDPIKRGAVFNGVFYGVRDTLVVAYEL